MYYGDGRGLFPFALYLFLMLFVGWLLWSTLPGDRSMSAPTSTGRRLDRAAPEDILAERFARGEIGEDEYMRRVVVLQSVRREGPDVSAYRG